MQIIAYRSSFIPCRNQKELLTPRVASAVNRYECFMENENMIRTFWGCKPCKKNNNIEPHQNFTGSYKNLKALDYVQNTQNINK